MKQCFLTALLLLAFVGAQAQHPLEAKLQPFNEMAGSPKVSLEYGLTKRLGLEAGIQFINDESTFDSTQINYRQRHYFATLKWYFSKETQLTGGYIGLQFFYEHFTRYEKDDMPAPIPYDNRAIAFEIGNKWLIWKKMVAELGGALGLEYQKGFNLNLPPRLRNLTNFDFQFLVKLGYRF